MKLRDYLKLRKISQREFARESGVSETRISRILSGEAEAGKTAIAKIVQATGGAVTIQDLWDLSSSSQDGRAA